MSTQTTQYPGAPLQQKKGLAVASLVLGILAIIGCLIPVLNIGSIVLAVIAIVLGVLALVAVKKGRAGGRGLAIAGLILSVLAVIGAVIANVVAGAFVSSVSQSIEEQEAADAAAASQFPGATADDTVGAPGDPLSVNDLTITATPLAPQTNDVLDTTYLCSTVTYDNTSTEPGTFNALDWSLQDPAGAARTWGAWGNNSLASGDLAPGGTVTGDVCFEGEPGPGQYVLLYDGSFFGQERGAWVHQF